MRVAVFFAYLCCLLLCADGAGYAAINHNGSGYSIARLPRAASFTTESQDYTFITNTHPDKEQEYFISEDIEDEDTNNIPAQKYKLMTRGHATHAYPSYPSILNYLCHCPKAFVAVCIPASDKCILQRALRI